MYQTLNTEVNVLSYYFSNGRNMQTFPRRIELEGRELDFLDGLRCLISKGQSFIQIFNMTDGRSQYRLSFEPEHNVWTLLGVKRMK